MELMCEVLVGVFLFLFLFFPLEQFFLICGVWVPTSTSGLWRGRWQRGVGRRLGVAGGGQGKGESCCGRGGRQGSPSRPGSLHRLCPLPSAPAPVGSLVPPPGSPP